MSLAAAMERHKAASFSYKADAVSAADTGKPAIFHQHSPSAELYDNRKYDLYISEASGDAYIIEARPVTGLPKPVMEASPFTVMGDGYGMKIIKASLLQLSSITTELYYN
jgi:hypothetical protein